MLHLLSEAGRSFLRAFAGSLVVLLPGILAAPNLNQMYAFGVAALIASVVAGLKAIQVFVPQLSFKSLLPARVSAYGNVIDSFVRAFLGTFIVLFIGVLNAPDLNTMKALIVAVLVGAVTAGFRAVQGLLTKGDVPNPETGLDTP
jgi:hypothetical protein